MLKKISLITAVALTSTLAYAKDNVYRYDFNQAVQNAVSQGLIDGQVKFYLAGTGGGGQVIQKGAVTNKKTRGAFASPEESCERALHSALIQLDHAAKARGATRVTNIVSYFKKNEYSSTSQYECYKGKTVTSVTLKGDLVR